MEINKTSWFKKFIDFVTPPRVEKKVETSKVSAPVVSKLPPKPISNQDLGDVIWLAESSRGTNLANDLPTRTAKTVPLNANDKAEEFTYDNRYAVQFGLTPIAIADIAQSQVNRDDPRGNINGPTNFIRQIPNVQKDLESGTTTTSYLATEIFNKAGKRLSAKDPEKYNNYTPEGLTNIYMDGYLGQFTGGLLNPNYNEKNRARIFGYFQEKFNSPE